jgi:predicted MFS family arabinose efflux permease
MAPGPRLFRRQDLQRSGRPSSQQPPPVQLTAILTLALVATTFIQADFGVLSKSIILGLHLSRTDLALALTVFAFVGAGTAPLMGRASDLLGGRIVLAGALALSAACTLLIAVVPGLPAMLAVATVAGFALGAGHPSTNKLTVVYVSGRPQGAVLGVKQSGPLLGVFLAGLILPSAAAAFGWRGGLALMAAIPLATLLWLALVVPADERGPREAGHRFVSPQGRATMWWLSVLAFIVAMAVASVIAFLPLYAQEGIGVSPRIAGVVASSVGLLAILARAAWGWSAIRFRHPATPLALISFLSMGAVAGLWAAHDAGLWLLWLAASVAGATLMAWHAVAWVVLLADVEAHSAGRASGMVHLGSTFGFGLGPLVFGLIVDHSSYGSAWATVTALLGVAFAATCVWLFRVRVGPPGRGGPNPYPAEVAVG